MSEIQDLLARLRSELDKKHEAGLKAIADLESQLLGQSTGSAAITLPVVAANATMTFTPPSGSDKINRVLGAIKSEFKTVEQIMADTGLTEPQVRAVIYSKFLKVPLEKERVGKAMSFRVGTAKIGNKPIGNKPVTARPRVGGGTGRATSVQQQVLALINKAPEGLTASELYRLLPQTNPKTIGGALYNLKNHSHVLHNEDTGVYRSKT